MPTPVQDEQSRDEKIREAQRNLRIRAAQQARQAQSQPPEVLESSSLDQMPLLEGEVDPLRPHAHQKTGVLENLTIPSDYVKMGLDAINTPQSLSHYLEQYEKEPSYTPGDPYAEAASSSVLGQTLAKSAADIGGDPLNWIGLGAKGVAKGGKAAIDLAGRGAAYTLGSVGNVLTHGQTTPASLNAGRKMFTPFQQMRPTSTLKKVGDAYNPIKTVARNAAAVQGSGPWPIIREVDNPAVFVDLRGAAEEYAQFLQKIAKSKGATGTDIYKGIPSDQMTLLRRLRGILDSGEASAPITAELKDAINRMDWTALGNPKAILPEVKYLDGALGAALDNVTGLAAPELLQGRKAYSAAKLMAEGTRGGKLTGMARNMITAAGLIDAGKRGLEGDYSGAAAEAAAALLLRRPGAWNAGFGAARIPGTLASQGLTMMGQNPQATQLALAGVSTLAQRPPSAFTPQDPALATIAQQFGPGGDVFISMADSKPSLYNTISLYATRNGNPQIAPFFDMASQMGLPGAMQMWQQQFPETWEPVSKLLPKIAMDAIKASPEIQTEMRRAIMFRDDISYEERMNMIRSVNDKSMFSLPR